MVQAEDKTNVNHQRMKNYGLKCITAFTLNLISIQRLRIYGGNEGNFGGNEGKYFQLLLFRQET